MNREEGGAGSALFWCGTAANTQARLTPRSAPVAGVPSRPGSRSVGAAVARSAHAVFELLTSAGADLAELHERLGAGLRGV